MNKIIFDLDDESDQHSSLQLLINLKRIQPNLKVNLFTIPNETSEQLLDKLSSYDWIQLIPHGVHHWSNYEFAEKTEKEALEAILSINGRSKYKKGFKAPGWQISEATMRVLKEQGYWVAVQWSDGRFNGDVNGPHQPKVIDGLKYYAINELRPGYEAIHGHTWDCCGNGLEQLWPKLINLPKDTEFVFIDDYVKETN